MTTTWQVQIPVKVLVTCEVDADTGAEAETVARGRIARIALGADGRLTQPPGTWINWLGDFGVEWEEVAVVRLEPVPRERASAMTVEEIARDSQVGQPGIWPGFCVDDKQGGRG